MMSYKDYRPRLKGDKKIAYDNLTKKEKRILIVGDLHAPFELCLLYTSPSPRDRTRSRMPSSA